MARLDAVHRAPLRRCGRCALVALACCLLLPLAFHLHQQLGTPQLAQQHGQEQQGAPGAAPVDPAALGSGPVVNDAYPVAVPGAVPHIPDLPAFAASLWDKYQQRLRSSASNSTVAYVCGVNDLCGGWGDRLRGITTLFYYALLTDAQFDILSTKLLDLATIYPLIAQRRPVYDSSRGQSVAWVGECRLSSGSSSRPAQTTSSCLARADGNMDFMRSQDVRADVQRPPAVHLIRSNGYCWHYLRDNPLLSETVAFYHLDKLTTFDMFRVVMELYFSQRSPELQQLVDTQAAATAAGDPRPLLVGVQIRNGGSWGDGERHPTASATQFAEQSLHVCKQVSVRLVRCGSAACSTPVYPACVSAPAPLPVQVDNRCSVYVTSDSMAAQDVFVEHLRRQAPNVSVTIASGAPVHVDRSSIEAGDSSALLKSYVDYELLRRADHLVISRSGFGETAAWARPSPAERLQLGQASNASFIAYDSVVGPPVGVPNL